MIFIYFVCIVKCYAKCPFRFLPTTRQHSSNHLDLMHANTPISPSPYDHAHALRRTPKQTPQHHAHRQQRNRNCSAQNTRQQQHPSNLNSSHRPRPPPKYANPLWGRGQACSQLPKEHPNRKTQHPELFCAEHLAAVTPNHEPQTTISPKTIRRNSRYSDGRLSAHAANCSAQNTLITKRAFAL